MVGNGKLQRWKFSFYRRSSSKSEKKKPPVEFICPISGSIMFDPVVVSSGETFERTSVEVCLELDFTPTLSEASRPDFSTVIPNLALKKAISNWCRSVGVDSPRYAPDYCSVEDAVRKLIASSKTNEDDSRIRVSERDLLKGVTEKPQALFAHAATSLNPRYHHHHFYSSSSEESVIANIPATPLLPFATRPLCYSSSSSASTSSEIVSDETLNPSPSTSTSDDLTFIAKLNSLDVFEQEQCVISLRKSTRTDEQARVSLCTPALLAALRPCIVSRYAAVQSNAVASLVNLSLENINKVKITRSGILPPVIDVLKAGFPESQEHAAGALFSLALHEENKTAIGVLGALPPLLHALRSDSDRTQHDSALALYHLSLVQSNRVKLVKLGAGSTLLSLLTTGLAGRVLLVLCNLAACNEGRSAMLDSNAVECLVGMLRVDSEKVSESTRENCVACLYSLSHRNMRFKGLLRATKGAAVLRQVAEGGGDRVKEKAKTMLMMMRETEEEVVDWEVLLEGGVSQTRYRVGRGGGGDSAEF